VPHHCKYPCRLSVLLRLLPRRLAGVRTKHKEAWKRPTGAVTNPLLEVLILMAEIVAHYNTVSKCLDVTIDGERAFAKEVHFSVPEKHDGSFQAFVRTHASLLAAPGSGEADREGVTAKASAAYPGLLEIQTTAEEVVPSDLQAAIAAYYGEEGLR
jgi:hypothetical protein